MTVEFCATSYSCASLRISAKWFCILPVKRSSVLNVYAESLIMTLITIWGSSRAKRRAGLIFQKACFCSKQQRKARGPKKPDKARGHFLCPLNHFIQYHILRCDFHILKIQGFIKLAFHVKSLLESGAPRAHTCWKRLF